MVVAKKYFFLQNTKSQTVFVWLLIIFCSILA
jgi:hypothetical protein